jgi:deoxyribonuclease (pyrimidine dimer)
MTRINAAIRPEALCDQHLVAEYRELGRVSGQLSKAQERGRSLRVPERFTLGRGHQTFFTDKGLYLERRFSSIVGEMLRRGMSPTYTELRKEPWLRQPELFRDWDDAEAFGPMLERVSSAVDRMAGEPRFAGKKIPRELAKRALSENKPLSLLYEQSTNHGAGDGPGRTQ